MLGIAMGAPWFQLKDDAKRLGVVARSSNYELYGDLSNRMMSRLARICLWQEVYSIDECFLGVPDLGENQRFYTAHDFAKFIRDDIRKTIGLPVSVAIAPTKTLAKALNHRAKDDPRFRSVCTIDQLQATEFTLDDLLREMPVGEVWGVGRALSKTLPQYGIDTAYDLKVALPKQGRSILNVNLERTISELNGVKCYDLVVEHKDRQSMIYSRMFSKPIKTLNEMKQVMSIYAQKICTRLRGQESVAKQITVFGSTSQFANARFHRSFFETVRIPNGTASPMVLAKTACQILDRVFEEGAWYNRAGLVLTDLVPIKMAINVLPLFRPELDQEHVSETLDHITQRFGEASIGIGLGGLKERPSWNMTRRMLSPRCTTHWDELRTVS
jgi:DNA polymerase V